MAAAVVSVTKPTDVRGFSNGNKRVRYFDITSDTGDYAANGFTVTAAQFGMKHVDYVGVGSAASQGTNGATALVVAVRYESSGTVIRFQFYESSGTAGAPPVEKNAEAMVANSTFRVRVEGTGTGA